MPDMNKIFSNFDIKDTVKAINPYGNGHINFTYLVEAVNQALHTAGCKQKCFPRR